ncbi:MAG TPA: tetratricopeptide repeat protein [Thermoanaerobaculales bacterium]|nr:tetratricopeptide repeat protein [Thermoanaerobaculales bacterium]HPA81855.1 tetratricopeptide repeat protein [Thermoanaerobaculales bacterium]HQL30696.1 tetratricopeptide repeat protein [Thermoanaerobaculales bacterium]HQN96647.1 tetratricopeptide repeat protein [Thermoanaerobaculales bacterium]HQP43301.1 tetratricopeptide repeat protein [Thermoanaerobaculales bacterium]
MSWPKALAVAWAALVVSLGCAHAAARGRLGDDGWAREVERRGVDSSAAVYPFTTTPEMERWVLEALQGRLSDGAGSQLKSIQQALFSPDFAFSYDADLTLTAAEAFATRRGNCLSFTAMFVAMARSVGIRAFLMSVQRQPEVDRDGSLVVVNRHVVAGHRLSSSEVGIFDFYVTSAGPYIQQRLIDDVTATAMYHTNLGGDAIRRGDLDAAVRHLGIATALAPEWAPGWVNLGVARYRLGDTEGAFADYQRALEAEPDNASALANMAFIYREQGRLVEAELALRAAAHQTTNPFTLIAMADAEMMRQQWGAAARYLRKARWWYRDEPEVYKARARLARKTGDPAAAERNQRRAAELYRRQASSPE